MPSTRAVVACIFALLLLGLAAVEGAVPALLVLAGVGEDAGIDAPLIRAVLAASGFVFLVVALFFLTRGERRGEQWAPYQAALKSFAAEYGRGVDPMEEGLQVNVVREGHRLELRLTPGRLSVSGSMPARQPLAWCRSGTAVSATGNVWRSVGTLAGCEMFAELPAMARPMLTDPALTPLLTRLFAGPETREVVHTVRGLTIESALPSAEEIGERARLVVEVAYTLRRLNG